MANDERRDIDGLAARVRDAGEWLHIDERRGRLTELDEQISQPGFWDDPQRAQEVSKEASDIRSVIEDYDRAVQLAADAAGCRRAVGRGPRIRGGGPGGRPGGKLLDGFEVQSWFSGALRWARMRFPTIRCGRLEAQDWRDAVHHVPPLRR